MKNKFLLSGVLFLGLMVGCQESDLDKLNPNGVTVDNFYKNGAELSSAVNAVYALAKSNALTSREWFFLHDLRSDDVSSGGGQLETARNQLLIGSYSTDNGVANAVWAGFYRLIHRANATLDLSEKVADIPAAEKARLLGEARFLRAWAYFDLVTVWGGVPLYKNYVTTVEGSLPRSPEKEVYDFIIADLKAAQEALPTTYNADNLGRATKGAAQMLLARVYLQQADYTNAKTELQKIITSGVYSLVDEYSDNFLEETEFNKESIWEINFFPAGGNYNWDADGNGATAGTETVRTQEYSAIGWRNVIPSNSLLNEFEKTATGRDPRFAKSFYVTGDKYNNDKNTLTDAAQNGNSSVVDGQTLRVSWRKFSLMYKTDQSYLTGGINQRIMRYAETLLAMAEVENELGNTAEAVKYLNQVRARKSVNMPPYPTAAYPVSTKDQVFNAIVHERRVELGGEQIRNRDILRWRKANKLKTEPFTYFQKGRHELLPIPQQEIDNNPKIEQADQNPGY
ncbi:RagB/SusD family nutrient uptake outer membrane protein [Larkinella harenae]